MRKKRIAYAALAKVLEDSYYEKSIIQMIDEIFDDAGNIKDNASEELQKIRHKKNGVDEKISNVSYHPLQET